MKLRHHRDTGFLRYLHKNAALVSGFAAVAVTVLFVSTVIISGQTKNIVTSDQSQAASFDWQITNKVVCADGSAPGTRPKIAITNHSSHAIPYTYTLTFDAGTAYTATLNPVTIGALDNEQIYLIVYYTNPTTKKQASIVATGGDIGPESDALKLHASNTPYGPGIWWSNGTPAGNYSVTYSLPADAPECSGSPAPVGVTFSGTASLTEAQCAVAGIAGTITLQMDSNNSADNGDYRIRIDKKTASGEDQGYAYSRDVIPFKTSDSWLTNVAPILKPLGTGDYQYQLEKRVNGNFVEVTNVKYPSSGYYHLTCSGTSPSGSPVPSPVACTNKDIMMVLDTSGSMSGQKVKDAQAAVQALVAKLPSNAGTRAGVVGFGSHAYTVADLTDTMSKVSGSVGKLKATGGTNLAEGITTGTGKLANDNRTHIMLILSDGLANLPRSSGVGPNDPAAYASGQAAAITAVSANLSKQLKTVFYTVGLGKKSQLNASFFDTLSSGTGGRSVYTSNSGDLDNLFASLTSDICRERPSNAGTNFLNRLQNINPPQQ